MELAPEHLRRIRRAFTNGLWVLGVVDVFWYPITKRIVLRCVEGRREAKELPRAVVLVGRYAYPCPADDFMDDLQDALDKF